MSNSFIDLGTIVGINLNDGSDNANIINNLIGARSADETLVIYSNISLPSGLIDDGVITLDPTILIVNGPLTGTGTVQIGSDSVLELNGSVAPTETIQFISNNANLILGDLSEFGGTISNFGSGNTIDITTELFASQNLTVVNQNTLEIESASLSPNVFLSFDTIASLQTFNIEPDPTGGTYLTTLPCFLKNTSISLKNGRKFVQDIKIGDLVKTKEHVFVPVKWIGIRRYRQPFTSKQKKFFPVLISANAISFGHPCSNLYVSQEHSILIEGYLIPAKYLINGKSIRFAFDFSEISYYHVELEEHDIIFAENLAVETFLNSNSRQIFENYNEYIALYGSDDKKDAVLCYPKLETGQQLKKIRDKLAERAGCNIHGRRPKKNLRFQGFVDSVNQEEINGWAWYPDFPNRHVELNIFVDKGLIAQVTADLFREDLLEAGIGNGTHGFRLRFNNFFLQKHKTIDVKLSLDGRSISQSPIALRSNISRLGHQNVRGKPFKRARPTKPKKVLILDALWPRVGDSAGSNALFDHIQIYQRMGFHVDFIALENCSNEVYQDLLQKNISPIKLNDFLSVELLLADTMSKYSIIYLNKIEIAKRYIGLVRALCHNEDGQPSFTIYNVADLHFLSTAREANEKKSLQLLKKAKALLFEELLVMQQVRAVITHSPVEAAYLKTKFPTINIKIVPWTVNIKKNELTFDLRSGIVFAGSFPHAPNRDAVEWLVHDIMPAVWAKDASLTLDIIGSGWSEFSFAKVDSRIRVQGRILDLATEVQKFRLTVAPLKFGSGIKGKVLDSLAWGVPAIMSPCAAEGLYLNELICWSIGTSTLEFASKIVQLHNDKKLNTSLSDAGYQMIERHYSEDIVIDSMKDILPS